MKYIGIFLAALVLIVYSCTFIVDQTQYAINIRLGDPVTVYKEPGLYFKLPAPISRIFYVDNRLMSYDVDPGSIFTKDKKEMIVDNYSKWRVLDPLKFYETVRSAQGAQSRLDDLIFSQVREELGKYNLVQIVSGNRSEIMEAITVGSREAAKVFGIEVVDVRIKRADLPEANSLSVYGRMEAERRREAKRYRSEGEEKSLDIRSTADRQRTVIIAEAQSKSEEIRGHADAESVKLYAEAYKKDPDFFEFQRSHDAYREALKDRAMLLLSTERQFFKHLK